MRQRTILALAAVVVLLVAFVPAGVVRADTIVYGDDFSGVRTFGDEANHSNYFNVPSGGPTTPGTYGVVNTPTAFTNPGYLNYFDHTVGTAAGAMLVFDGSPNPTQSIWIQSISLDAGQQYTFSYWGSAATAGSQRPVLRFLLDGVAVSPLLVTSSGLWRQVSSTFTASSTGLHSLAIVDLNTFGPTDNDGAIDDILLTTPGGAAAVPLPLAAPAGLALMAGIGFTKIRLRRKPACSA